MITVLVAGAGKSSTYLIEYLLQCAQRYKWEIIVADGSAEAISKKLGDHPHGRAAAIDITNDAERRPLVQQADLVVSLMPPHLHLLLAKDCLDFNKNLITASYVSPEMKELDQAAKEKGLLFMCEMGLDPGIDHMTASQIIHSIQKVRGSLCCFKSYCGGLVAPEDDDNPWHYKFSWNPRNVLMAGMAGAEFLQRKKPVQLDYKELFDPRKKVKIDELGTLGYYPNRDSLHYLELYQTHEASTFMRATLRYPDFMCGWRALIDLGLTELDDHLPSFKTAQEWVAHKTGFGNGSSQNLQAHVAKKLNESLDSKTMSMLQWLGLFAGEPLSGQSANSSGALEEILLRKWALGPDDKDMVVMAHEMEYEQGGQRHHMTSTMILKGEGGDRSAMAKTVGLPMAILAELLIHGKISQLPTGVCVPTMPAIYKPVLKRLEHQGIVFKEEVN